MAQLPDFQRLTFLLNSSGVQKWNPDIYSILNQLIFAVQQSQNVVVNKIPSNASTIVVGNALSGDGSSATPLNVNVDGTTVDVNGSNQLESLVVTDPAGALNGNGTPASKLAVSVDGTTIQINGSNQLISIPVGAPILTQTFTLSLGQMQTMSSSPVSVIPGVGGQKVVPIATVHKSHMFHQFNQNVIGTLRYSGIAVDLLSMGLIVQGGLTPCTSVDYYGTGIAVSAATVNSNPIGLGIVIKGSVDAAIGFCATGGDQVTGTIYYVVL